MERVAYLVFEVGGTFFLTQLRIASMINESLTNAYGKDFPVLSGPSTMRLPVLNR